MADDRRSGPANGDTRWADDMPATYHQQLGPVVFAPFADLLAEAAAQADPPPRRVLELAAGTGILTRALLDRLPGAEVTATDLNLAMVGIGERNAGAARWQQADATALPFADRTFDLVACAFGAMFFEDKVACFAESGRVLEPGGRLLLSIWGPVETSTFTAELMRVVGRFLLDPPDFLVRIPHGYADPDAIRAHLTAAGLLVRQVEPVTLTVPAPSVRALAEGFCYGTPLRFGLAERGELDQLAGRIVETLVAELGAGPIDVGMAALLVRADKPEDGG